ncbi:MAG: translation initiation factor IF-3 [Candidatus Omnitrophica bacterium CG11_big_fil_rev_8_21_14_0_20_64_10]|nr:MAG: translation initiation factor IF-3 [Candidatus Omnitrophica bacterium CG11_big_fil_rev_8_21_14_0_20_64_10]
MLTRVNEQIRVPQVRLVGQDGQQLGVVPVQDAIRQARQVGADLVEVAAQAKPPVCRIMDYAKYRYEKEKQQRESRSHHRGGQLKELRFRPQIDDHDYETKMKSLVKFLEKGNKVKVTLMYRGREMAHQEFGRRLLDRIQKDLADQAAVERAPMQEGRFVFMTLSPLSPSGKAKGQKKSPSAGEK